ncbi:hypothetical protein PJ15_1315 [Acinetobacter sp. neg1]|nr:hypothetical protein PJ15_1315 [Acinetobacter sp. neg1]
MDAARWAVVYGYTISPTKDFCYFLSLKSKAMPIQKVSALTRNDWLCKHYP